MNVVSATSAVPHCALTRKRRLEGENECGTALIALLASECGTPPYVGAVPHSTRRRFET
jgi:hypothetical protein